MNLRLDEIAKAVGGAMAGPADVKVQGYSIDTRTLKAGELFFAIKGPRFDGHDFIRLSLARRSDRRRRACSDRSGFGARGSAP